MPRLGITTGMNVFNRKIIHIRTGFQQTVRSLSLFSHAEPPQASKIYVCCCVDIPSNYKSQTNRSSRQHAAIEMRLPSHPPRNVASLLPHSLSLPAYGEYAPKRMHELCPPKPNELESATSTLCLIFSEPTTSSRSTSGSGSVRFRFGCSQPVLRPPEVPLRTPSQKTVRHTNENKRTT